MALSHGHHSLGGAKENTRRRDKNKVRLCVIVEICYLCMREAASALSGTALFSVSRKESSLHLYIQSVRSASAILSVHHTILLTYAAKRQHCYYSYL